MKTINNELFSQQSCNFKFLAKEGFNTPKYYELDTFDDFENLIIDNLNTHDDLGVDGFVQELEEFNENTPLKIYFNYDSVVQSTLTDVVWIPNPSGELIPTAVFEEVVIGDISYTSCSLKNMAYLEKLITSKKMMIGDVVHITLRDNNIPIIIGVATHNNKVNIEVPSKCPVCEDTLDLINSKFVCSNRNCSVKIKDILLNYFELINHKMFDDSLLLTMVKDFDVTSITDLKNISESDINKMKDGADIFTILHTKQTINKQQLINLTQPINNGVGVIGYFMSNTDTEVLLDTNTTATDIIDISMVDDSAREELTTAINSQLATIRENSKFFNIEGLSVNTLNNNIFCLTNTMKHGTMKHYEKLIVESGGRIGAVSMKLHFLVTNEKDNTQYNKVVETNTKLYNNGKAHSIHVIDESELLKMMEK